MKTSKKICGKFAVKLAALCLGVSMLCGCVPAYQPQESTYSQQTVSSQSSEPVQESQPAEDSTASQPEELPEDPVETLLSTMTLREKVGQLFLIRPDSLDFSLSTETVADANAFGVQQLSVEMRASLEDYPVGGIVLFGKNISDPGQVTTLIADFQAAAPIGLFVGVDEEGGKVSRLANSSAFHLPTYESMTAVGNTGDPSQAYDVGTTIGGYLAQYGFNLDFAPDADVNTNPDNPVIGTRSFGADASLVSQMVSSEIDGLHDSGVMSCIKHFPGHGDTQTDTHKGYASTAKTWEEMASCELLPFEAGIAAGTDMIMVAHITAVQVTDDGLPSSLSYEMITGKLRNELGYTGVVITDALAMGAVTQEYSSAEAAVKAFLAGNDLLLMPQDFTAAFDGMVQAVQDGTVSQERLDESVRRILQLKQRYGLL